MCRCSGVVGVGVCDAWLREEGIHAYADSSNEQALNRLAERLALEDFKFFPPKSQAPSVRMRQRQRTTDKL
jgi:hypothetical protein